MKPYKIRLKDTLEIEDADTFLFALDNRNHKYYLEKTKMFGFTHADIPSPSNFTFKYKEKDIITLFRMIENQMYTNFYEYIKEAFLFKNEMIENKVIGISLDTIEYSYKNYYLTFNTLITVFNELGNKFNPKEVIVYISPESLNKEQQKIINDNIISWNNR